MVNQIIYLTKAPISKLILLVIFSFVLSANVYSCDTSPVVTASNVVDIGGGFWTIDMEVCFGVNGSEDGFDVTVDCANITATDQAFLTNSGNDASFSISGGVLTYDWPGFPPTWWEPDDGIAGPCHYFTITVDANPAGCTATVTGINDGCQLIATSWDATIPGPCIVDYSMTGAGSQAGNTTGAGNNCPARGSQDEVIQVDIPCDDTWTFDLCGTSWDTYLYIGTTCCGTNTGSNDDNCGLQSSITQALTAGTYYVIVEAYSSGTTGSYTLNVSSSTPCVLPVELISFEGENLEDDRNKLTWNTASEINNDYFLVQKSIDGMNFIDIGTVKGMGNSNVMNYYTFYDEEPYHDITYYRLKQTDFNGEFEYTKIISVQSQPNGIKGISELFPNPALDNFTFQTNIPFKNNLKVVIRDGLGKTVKDIVIEDFNSNTYTIPIKSLDSGFYYVTFYSGNQSISKKLTISR